MDVDVTLGGAPRGRDPGRVTIRSASWSPSSPPTCARIVLPGARPRRGARALRRRRRRRRHVRDRRAGRGADGGVPRRARSRRRLLLGGPRHGHARRRAALGARRRPDRRDAAGPGRASSRPASRSRRRRSSGEPTMADVEVGCVVEIKSGARFLAVRGAGVEPGRRGCRPRRASSGCSGPTGSAAGRWSPTAIVLEELIDGSSVAGGTFDLGSATYDMTRLVTGQLDAYVEPGPRMIDEVDWVRAEFERVGGGAILNNSPYDLAAARPDPRRGRGRRHRRERRPARRPAAARLRPRVPDVVRLRRQRRAARGDHRGARSRGIERLRAAGPR